MYYIKEQNTPIRYIIKLVCGTTSDGRIIEVQAYPTEFVSPDTALFILKQLKGQNDK